MTNAESDVTNTTVRCVENARWGLMGKDIHFIWDVAGGYGQNKSKCVSVSKFFLETGIPYLISIDRDMGFFQYHVERLYRHLLSGYDLISGIYCLRNGKRLSGHLGYGREGFSLDDGIVEFQYVPMGFMGISRRLLQKMVDELQLPLLGDDKFKFYPFFEQKVSSEMNELCGDDTSFCEKAHKVGVKAYVDTSIQVGHMGDKFYTVDDYFEWQDSMKAQENLEGVPNILVDLSGHLGLSPEEVMAKVNNSIEDYTKAWKVKDSIDNFYVNEKTNMLTSAYWNMDSKRHSRRVEHLTHLKGLNILDIGCGIGTVVFMLEKQGNTVTGYDLNEEAINFCNYRKERHSMLSRFTTCLPKDLSNFDVITCVDTLEHIEDLERFITMLGECMKPGAKLAHRDDFTPAPSHFDHSRNIDRWLTENGFEIKDKLWAIKK